MSRSSSRGARKMFTRQCANLKCRKKSREFTAFRSNARYCTDYCRNVVYQSKLPTSRNRILKKYDGKCAECGSQQGRLFVRKVGRKKLPLCGFHNSALTNEMFRARLPKPGRGYARRKFIEKLDADQENGA